MVARDTRIRRRAGGRFDEVAPDSAACLFVFLDVYVDGEDPHGFCHYEGEGSKVEGPAVVVLVLLVLIFLVAGITGVAGDVNNDADDIAQAWRDRGRTNYKTLPQSGSGHD